MTRAEKVAKAQALRAEGLKVVEIAERMGVARATAGAYLSDPDLSKQRERRYRYAGTCVDCGAPTNGSHGHGKGATRCLLCERQIMGERKREAWAPYRAKVEQMWADGMTTRQIGAALGWNPKHRGHISTLRARGYNLPHRRTPEQIARITADGGEHLRRARAALAAKKGA